LLGKVLATLLAVNMAIMLALPIGIFADDIANNGVTNVVYDDPPAPAPAESTPSESTPPPATTINTGGGSADPGTATSVTAGEGTTVIVGEGAAPASSAEDSSGTIGLYNYPFSPAGSTASVGTWDEFWAAWNNASVSIITLKNDITRNTTAANANANNRLSRLNRDLKITSEAGGPYVLSLGTEQNAANSFNLANRTAAQPATLGFYNVKIGRNSTSTTVGYRLVTAVAQDGATFSNAANTAGWTIVFSDVSNGGTSAASGLLNLPGSRVIYDETVTWNVVQTGTAVAPGGTVSYSSRVEITANAKVTLSTTHNTTINILGGANSYFKAEPGAVVDLQNKWTGDGSSETTCPSQTIWFHGIATGNTFDVNGAEITCVSNGTASVGNQSGVWNFNGANFALTIRGGAKISLTSLGRMAAFVSNVNTSSLTFTNPGTKFYATSSRGYVDYAATFRIRNQPNQTFNVTDYAEFKVLKTAAPNATNSFGEVAAFRFGEGGNNKFNVNSGGKIYIENQGTGTPMNPAITTEVAGGENVGLEVGSDGLQFLVQGKDSLIEIKAHNGAAFNAGSRGGINVDVRDGATFVADGRTANRNYGTFRATGTGSTFNFDSMLYYDFRNDLNLAPSGTDRTLIFQVGSTSTFTSTNSDLSVWTSGSNLDGNPTKDWSKISYRLTGVNFGTIVNPPVAYPTFASDYGNMANYSRMSGNNATPSIESIAKLTNADKYVRAHATVPEGPTQEPRPAWDNEIWGNFLRTPAAGGATQQLPYRSINAEPVYTVEDVETLRGVLRYDNVNAATNNFLLPGDKYSLVKSAWRGPEGKPELGHAANPADITNDIATVVDVTPPDRVTVTGAGRDFDTATYTGKMYSDERVLEGSYPNMAASASAAWNSEPIAKIYAIVNGTGAKYDAVLNTAARTWRIDLTGLTLTAGDVVSIVAVDSNNNENPIADRPFRDTTFLAASKLVVSEFPIDFNIATSDVWIGLLRANTIKSGPPTTQDPGTTLEARMLDLLNASATVKPGFSTPISTDLIISSYGVAPNVFSTTDFTRAAFGTANKEYTITVALKDYPGRTATAKVTVYPYDDLVQADDIEIWQNQAIDLLKKTPPASALHADLISLGKAVAASGANSATGQPLAPWSSANVDVLDYYFDSALTGATTPDYYVTFALKTDHTVTRTVKISVKPNNLPILNVTNPVVIWTGDPAATDRTPGSLTPTQFNSLPGDKWKNGVTALDGDGTNITSAVTYSGEGAVNFSKISDPGEYIVTYSVTNSHGVTVSVARTYVVTNVGNVFGNFRLDVHSFVVKPADANANNILAKSEASGWEFDASLPAGGITRPVLVTANSGYGVGAAINTDFGITVNIPASNSQPNPPGPATRNIVAKIVNKDVLTENGKDNITGKKYSIGANNYLMSIPEAATLVGTTDAVKTLLINKAQAEGWLLDSTLTAKNLTVTYNGIPAVVRHSEEFNVTFAIGEATGISVTVKFRVTVGVPVITFAPDTSPGAFDGGSPLVISKTATSHKLTLAELKQKVTPSDPVDTTTWLLNAMQVHVPGGTALPEIDTMNVGVYRVAYDVTNSGGIPAATAYRAIVVTDGRYSFDREGGGVGATGLIIGAQDFVQRRAAVNGNIDQARDWSYAEAFSIEGNPLTVTAANPTGTNTGAAYAMQPPFDAYPFTWGVAGHALTKRTTGHVVDADGVWPGTKNNPYAVTAKDFAVNPVVAADIIAKGSNPGGYMTAANAKAYKLVSTIAGTVEPYINARGVPTLFAAVEGVYPGISFGVAVNGTQLGSASTASITGTVSTGHEPDLQVSRPFGVTVGSTFNPMNEVSAVDPEDGPLTSAVKYNLTSALGGTDRGLWTDIRPANPINTANIGLYSLTYWVYDSDFNVDEQKRVVVVNDGRYVLGLSSEKGASGTSASTGIDGKILYGRSFVVKSEDVKGNLNEQIISNSAPSTFNGSTGVAAASAGVSVYNSGTYGAAPNNYTITLQANDIPSGYIQKNIIGKVVDATTLANTDIARTTFTDWSSPVSGQVVTPTQNGEGAITYVYGTSIAEMRPSEATAILSAANPNEALIAALKASAVIATPGFAVDTMTNTSVKVVSVIREKGGSGFSAAVDKYRVLIADTANKSSIWLTIVVAVGKLPWMTVTPKPLNITAATTAGFITDAQVRAGVSAGDDEDGDLTSKVTYKIYNQDGTLAYTYATGDSATTIPRESAGFYRVVYTVRDSDTNEATESRALLVNDGRYTYDNEYVIEGRSFVIGVSEVLANPSTPQAQIIDKSGARAWTIEGDPAALEVKAIGSYGPAVTDAQPELGIVGYAPAVPFGKTITARIYVKGDDLEQGQGVNGERYSLRADNFRINIADANALKAQTGTVYANALVNRALAKSYDRSSSNFVQSGSVGLVNDGSFKTVTFLSPSDPGYPTKVPITFCVNEETGTEVTIYAVVSNGTYPTILVDSPKAVAFGGTFGEAQYMQGVTAHDSEDGDITSRITHNTPVDTSVYGPVTVTYEVTDLENNRATATGQVVVGGIINGSYWVQPGYDFVTIPSQAPTTDSAILAAARAKAQRIDAIPPDSPADLPVDVSPIVYDKPGYATTVGDYPITIGVTPVAPYTIDDPAKFPTITAKIIDREIIATDTVTTKNASHYAIASSSKVLLKQATVGNYVGTSAVAKANLVTAARAVAYKMDIGPVTVNYEVDVKFNNIPASPVYGTEYPVVFTPKDQPGVELTVMFTLADEPPTIVFSEDPLVVKQTPASHIMTADELKAQSTATNSLGTNIKSLMTATPATGGSIDQHNIGIYLVNYRVVDPITSLETTAQRYVVVDDGRYTFIDEDGDDDTDVVVGARDFLTLSSAVTGGKDEVRAWSFAEAFDNITHTALRVDTTLPTGWGATPAKGTYSFTWTPDGHPTVTKTIKGIVTDADVVDPGTKNSQYGMIGYHFSYIGDDALTRARTLIAAGDPGFITEARAEVIPLVSGTPTPAARVIDRGGFTDAYGVYDIRFGAAGEPDAQPTVTITSVVYPTALPTLNVPTPINVWIGDPSDPERPVESILPSDYTGALYGVTAHSDKDGDLIGSVGVTGDTVDLTAVGFYHLHYTVSDSDGRTAEADRLVVVNDGRMVVGKSRVLLVNGFVIKSDDVAAPAGATQQLKDKSDAALFDGKTGARLSGALISVANNGGYSSAPNDYRVTFTAPDPVSGTLSKTVTVKVIPEKEIGGPDPSDPLLDSTYTYGTSITVTTAQMEAIILGGNAATLAALNAHATKTKANGTLESVDVKVVDYDKPLATTPGIYTVSVSDVDDQCVKSFTISTWFGHAPEITAPKPLVVQWANSTTNLTRAELMDGTYAPKSSAAWHVTANDDEDGDLTSAVTITDPATGLFPVIPHNAVGTYKVRYYVEDSDHNFAEVYRAVIIDDGNTIYDDKYVLQAASFVIGVNQVDTADPNAQILGWSNAVATTTEGDPASASVAELGAYTNTVGPKKPLINVSGHPTVYKEITALVYDRGEAISQAQGENGSLYSLLAKNFRINITDANALKAQTGAAYDDAFITRAAAESYLRNDPSLVQGGTVKVVDTGNFKTVTFLQPDDPGYPSRVPITFCVNEETGTTVTIYAYVSNGNDPTLTVPIKSVALNSVFGDAQYLENVTAADNEDGDLTSAITFVPTKPVNTAVKGVYWADYTVADSDYNAVTTRGIILVDIPIGDYVISPSFDFVMVSSKVTGTDAEIVEKSHAQAWRIANILPDNDTLPFEVPSALFVANNGGYGSLVGDYNITLGINPTTPYVTDPANFPTIKAKVIDQDLINTLPGETDPDDGTKVTPDDGNDKDPSDPANRYAVAAERVVSVNTTEVTSLVGSSTSAKTNLIKAAKAVAYKINGSTGITNHDVDVTANEITAGAKAGDSFYVTFIPKGVPTAWIKVKFVVSDGNPPVITTTGPLVVNKTADSQLMTNDELKQGVIATDVEDGLLTDKVAVTDPATGKAPEINKNTVGVYQIHYAVSDSSGNAATASRAVIVTDGRYDLIEDDPSKPGEITYIIGAKNFVVRQADCAATEAGQLALAKEKSYLEVFSAAGSDAGKAVASGQIVLQDSAAAGFLNRQPGTYAFKWALVGHPKVAKSNTGLIVSNEYVVDSGGKNSVYAVVAKSFTVDEAAARSITAEPAYLSNADAYLVKLVDKAPNKTARLIDNGGFRAAENTYKIKFGDDTADRGGSVFVTVDGTVKNNARTFTVTFNANGGTLVGPSRISVTEPSTTLPYMPASPIRTGYTFRYWSTSSANNGAQFAYNTALTGDITLYALWDQIPVPRDPVVNVVVNVPPSGGGGANVTVQTPASTITEVPTPTTPEPETPATIEPTPTPLAPPTETTWSLFDLLATILAAVMLIVFFVKFFFDRPKDEVYEEEPIDAQLWAAMTPEQRAQYQARRESDYQVWLSDQQRAANRPKALFVNAPVLLIVAIALVEAFIVLFTTQSFGGTMMIVDDLSVIFALILFVQLLSPMVAAVIRNNRRVSQQFSISQPPAGVGTPIV
jgi:uncharacterized repeat protein (TIGR02543 family)